MPEYSEEVRAAVKAFNAIPFPTKEEVAAINALLFPDGKPEKMGEIEWRARHRTSTPFDVSNAVSPAPPPDVNDPFSWMYSDAGTKHGYMGTESTYDQLVVDAKRGDEVAQKVLLETNIGTIASFEKIAANPSPLMEIIPSAKKRMADKEEIVGQPDLFPQQHARKQKAVSA